MFYQPIDPRHRRAVRGRRAVTGPAPGWILALVVLSQNSAHAQMQPDGSFVNRAAFHFTKEQAARIVQEEQRRKALREEMERRRRDAHVRAGLAQIERDLEASRNALRDIVANSFRDGAPTPSGIDPTAPFRLGNQPPFDVDIGPVHLKYDGARVVLPVSSTTNGTYTAPINVYSGWLPDLWGGEPGGAQPLQFVWIPQSHLKGSLYLDTIGTSTAGCNCVTDVVNSSTGQTATTCSCDSNYV